MHAPICYIQPDNSFGIKNKVFSRLNSADVEINISKYVDGNGKLYLPYILEWKPKTSNIIELIKDYKLQFVEQSPIFLRSQGRPQPQVFYMSSIFWLLRVESRDFSQAENETTACKAEQIHKMTVIFTQSGPRLSFLSAVTSSCFFLSLRKIT